MPRLQAVSLSPTPFFAFASFPAYSLGYEDIYKDYYCGAGHLAGGVLSSDFLRCPLYGGGCARPATTARTSRATSTTMATPTTTSTFAARMGALFRLCQFPWGEIDCHPCASNNLAYSGESGWSCSSLPPE